MRALLLPYLFLLAGCGAVPGAPEDDLPPARDTMRVEILDQWFVRVDGERLARHEFVYRSRLQGRAWAEQKLAAPRVQLTWVPGAAPRAVVDDLIRQLRLAGVKFIDLGSG